MVDLKETDKRIMQTLKNFQQATVRRVDELFRNGQNRVLVADEVGLGKTLVARGVIAKTARLRSEQGDNLFKVVYICSNQNIASQNIGKLKISEDITVDGVTDTRLSMQHLKIFEQENDSELLNRFIQLIPLTPDTSFRITIGCGSVRERALIFAVLRQIPDFSDYLPELETLMTDTANASWQYWMDLYENRVEQCNLKSKGNYLSTMRRKLEQGFAQNMVDRDILSLCSKIRTAGGGRIGGAEWNSVLGKIRMLFAQISVDLLEPDLVILDEFQRFRFLIGADGETETGLLARRFFSNENVKILLLSATPYKLYSTLEEISESGVDEHYAEFFEVIRFLLNDKSKLKEFRTVWDDYSASLREFSIKRFSVLQFKRKAEDALYQGVCRTERISAIKTGDFIDDSSIREPLQVNEKDIGTYLQAQQLLSEIGEHSIMPVDYVKSCPYPLSFMMDYKIKKKLEQYFSTHSDEVQKARKDLLWVDERKLRNYVELDRSNARLEKLKEIAFQNKAELLLWIPPSKPYYEPQGVFRNAEGFSKTLVFSSWEMVPRMIAALMSYEYERKTVGRLAAQAKNADRRNATYFTKSGKRYPSARLRFSLLLGEPKAMSLFCLLYPSAFLANSYQPIDCLNKGLCLREIERQVKAAVTKKLASLKVHQKTFARVDERWYHLAPLLMDDPEAVSAWLNSRNLINDSDDGDADSGQKGYRKHVQRLKEEYEAVTAHTLALGRMPDDLADILTNMAIASPAVCLFRAIGSDAVLATRLAKTLINRLNSPESTAVIELCCGKLRDDGAHWQNVLRYFKDGNFQSVADEYAHMLTESFALQEDENRAKKLYQYMEDAFSFRTSAYSVDTYRAFEARAKKLNEKEISMRSHFAVGFYKGKGEESKQVNHKESIRNAFNSPLRPFVLATTSIGQEGLDFHYYCRRVVHWNLPSNPVDLEQREGRVNRFECLAIRQSIAEKYGNIKYHNDIWEEMFRYAEKHEAGECELIPYWCLPNDQKYKIERIVPEYPLSRDIGSYERLIQILSLYRLSLGQPRQEELLETIFQNAGSNEDLKELFINLSPFYRKERR